MNRLELDVAVESRAFVSGEPGDVIALARAALDACADGRLRGFHLYEVEPGRRALTLEPAAEGELLARGFAESRGLALATTCSLCKAASGGRCFVHRGAAAPKGGAR